MAILQSTNITGSLTVEGNFSTTAGGHILNATTGVIQLKKNNNTFVYINDDSYGLRLTPITQVSIDPGLGVVLGANLFNLGTISNFRGLNIRDGWMLGIGNNPDISYKFHVEGPTKLQGANDLSDNYALKVQNSSGTDILAVENDGKVYFKGGGYIDPNFTEIKLPAGANSGTRLSIARSLFNIYLANNVEFTLAGGLPASGININSGRAHLGSYAATVYAKTSTDTDTYYGTYQPQASGYFASNSHKMISWKYDGDGHAGTRIMYTSASANYTGLLVDRYGDVEIPNGSLTVTNSITSSILNLNDGQSNIIVSDQTPNLDSTSNNNIIIGLGAAQNMSGSNVNWNTIIGHNAAKELSNINSRYNTIIGYNAFSDHSGSNSTNHTIIGYNAGLGMSSAGYPNSTVIIGANAKATNSFRSMAIGTRSTSGYNGHAIGYEASAPSDGALAVGAGASAQTSGTAIGQQSSATASSIAIGRAVNATSGAGVNIGSSGNTYQGVLIGYSAVGQGNQGVAIGFNVGNGSYSSTIGYQAGKWNTGNSNVTVGRYSMMGVSGSTNVFNTVAIGEGALQNITTGQGNTAVGYQAGNTVTTGINNTILGYSAGGTNNSYTTLVGYDANADGDYGVAIGWLTKAGSYSTSIGTLAGANSAAATYNVYIGHTAGRFNSGDRNVFIGRDAGANGSTASDNIFLGYQAGRNETGSNKLYIENSQSPTPLIYGEFDNDLIRINGTLETTNSATISGSLTIASSGSTVLDVQGSLGQLFSVNDSFSGSLFKVATISGMPVVEAFSDNTVKIGTFNNEAIVVSGSHTTLKDTVVSGSVDILTPVGNSPRYPIKSFYRSSNVNWHGGLQLGWGEDDGSDPFYFEIDGYNNASNKLVKLNFANTTGVQLGGAPSFGFSSEIQPSSNSSTGGIVTPYHQNGYFRIKSNSGGTYDVTSWIFKGEGGPTYSTGEVMRIGGDGKVGIGTTLPTASLHIKAPNNLNDNYALKVTDNSDNDILTVENNGRVGIGTTSPQYPLEISGSVKLSGNVGINRNPGTYPTLKITAPSGNDTRVIIGTNQGNTGEHILGFAHHLPDTSVATGIISQTTTSNGDGRMYLCVRDGSDGSTITTSDAVISLTATSVALNRTLQYNDNLLRIGENNSGDVYFRFRPESKAAIASKYLGSYNRGDFRVLTYPNADGTVVNIDDHTRLIVDPNGNVGIGTTSPQTKLHVSGSILGSVTDITPTNQTASLDCSLSNFFTLTLSSSADTLLTASNIQPGQTINLRITQPATSGSLSYGSEFKFPNGLPYQVSATSSVDDIVSFIAFDSTTLYGSSLKNFV